jgi:hypothetical protein
LYPSEVQQARDFVGIESDSFAVALQSGPPGRTASAPPTRRAGTRPISANLFTTSFAPGFFGSGATPPIRFESPPNLPASVAIRNEAQWRVGFHGRQKRTHASDGALGSSGSS